MQAILRELFPGITPTQLEQLARYQELLVDWNQRTNLVSRTDVQNLFPNHLLPSLGVLGVENIPENRWVLDIGSGGGLPAIPLKIMRPDLQFVLVDSIRKKTLFLKHVIKSLELDQIMVVNERVEKLAERFEFQQKFDIITARAVAAIGELVVWGEPFLRPGGYYLLWKGDSDQADLTAVAAEQDLQYHVLKPRAQWMSQSAKFSTLQWFKLGADLSGHIE